jgi:hypothetical protein
VPTCEIRRLLTYSTWRFDSSFNLICGIFLAPNTCLAASGQNQIFSNQYSRNFLVFWRGMQPRFFTIFLRHTMLLLFEPVFLNVYGAKESIPRNEFLQPM